MLFLEPAPATSGKANFSKTSKLEEEVPEAVSTRAPTGKGMQLGRPKKIQGASQLSHGFGFDEDKASKFATKEEEKEPEVPSAPEAKVDLTISEQTNCEVNKFGEV
jgi:hypothetical protein